MKKKTEGSRMNSYLPKTMTAHADMSRFAVDPKTKNLSKTLKSTKFRTKILPKVLIILLYYSSAVRAFNLDTKLPVYKTANSKFSNSYFGFSLAFSNETNEVYVGAPKAELNKKGKKTQEILGSKKICY